MLHNKDKKVAISGPCDERGEIHCVADNSWQDTGKRNRRRRNFLIKQFKTVKKWKFCLCCSGPQRRR